MLAHLATNHDDRAYRTQPQATEPQALRSTESTTVAVYLNTRLRQIGVRHVYCIPGDYLAEYCETLDDASQNAGLIRVHPNNEMCATYAADGYGRATNGTVGCVAFTYGAGGLGAAQAVAGAHVERVPMVVINGSPSVAQLNSLRDQGVLYHHMVDGAHTDERVLSEVTETAVRLDNPATAPDLIDAALRTCLTASRPVYLELASQTAHLPCRAVPPEPLTPGPLPATSASVAEASAAILARLRAAERVVVVGGSEIARRGLQTKLADLIRRVDCPYATSPLGKSVLSELRSDLRFAGVYFGKSSPPELAELMDSSDCVLSLGVLDTDFNYLGVVTPDYDPNKPPPPPGPNRIQARDGAVLVGRQLAYWGDVSLEALLDAVLEGLGADPLPHAPFPGPSRPPAIPDPTRYAGADPITYDSFKSLLNAHLLAGHHEDNYPQIVADSGFSFLSNIDLPCAEGGYIAQLAWAAIGYGVGATSGVTLANEAAGRHRRAITITGDAAFAESLNALGTIAQLGQDAVIFVMDNRVFAVEQWLIDADAFCDSAPPPEFAALTDVPQGHIWDYVKLAEGFGGRGFAVQTNAQLAEVLAKLHTAPTNPVSGRPTFTVVAVRLPRTDLPGNARWKMNCG